MNNKGIITMRNATHDAGNRFTQEQRVNLEKLEQNYRLEIVEIFIAKFYGNEVLTQEQREEIKTGVLEYVDTLEHLRV